MDGYQRANHCQISPTPVGCNGRKAYESDGQKDKVTEHRGSVTTVYDWTYDALNRLTDESYTNGGDAAKNYAAHYDFDLAGNRVSKTQTGADAGATASTYNENGVWVSKQIVANTEPVWLFVNLPPVPAV